MSYSAWDALASDYPTNIEKGFDVGESRGLSNLKGITAPCQSIEKFMYLYQESSGLDFKEETFDEAVKFQKIITFNLQSNVRSNFNKRFL